MAPSSKFNKNINFNELLIQREYYFLIIRHPIKAITYQLNLKIIGTEFGFWHIGSYFLLLIVILLLCIEDLIHFLRLLNETSAWLDCPFGMDGTSISDVTFSFPHAGDVGSFTFLFAKSFEISLDVVFLYIASSLLLGGI